MMRIPDIPITALIKTTGGQSAPFQNSLLSKIPPLLLNAPTGSLVNAVVTGIGQGGNFTLKTPNGLLSIQTTLPLQQGNILEFQVANPGKDFQLLLVAINAQTINKPPKTNTESKKPETKDSTTYTATEEELLFTVTPKTKQQPQHSQLQQAPAVTTETPSFQPGQTLQTTLATIQEENIDALLKLFIFDASTGKLIPTTQTETTSISPNIVSNFIKSGTVFSFRILDITLPIPNTTQQPLPTTTSSPPATPSPNISAPIPFSVEGNQPVPSVLLNAASGVPSQQTPSISQVNTTNQIPTVISTSVPSENDTLPQSATQNSAQKVEFSFSQTLPTANNNSIHSSPNLTSQVQPIISNPIPTPNIPIPTQQNIPVPNTITNYSNFPDQQITADIVSSTTQPNPRVPETVTNRLNGLPLVIATVFSAEKSGDTILKTPFGTLRLNLNTALPKNTTLYLELAAIIPLPITQQNLASAQPSQVVSDGIPQLIKHWSTLDESIKVVQQTNPSLANKLHEALPSPDKNLGAKLIHFINTLQSGGSISEWLGQAFIKTLQQEKKTDILTQLTKEFATLRSAFTESPSTNWQTLIFPVFSEGALHQARMYIRNTRDNDKQNRNSREKGADARFVVEVDLEKLGSMQFDGLVKNVDNSKFFDLVIRSHKPLDKDITRDILDIFTTTQEVTGLKGRISFENTTRFPINPTQEILAMETNIPNSIVV